MNIGLQQVIVFLLMVATGCLGGICFDFYRAIRYTSRPKKIGTLIGDILFWVCWAIILFSILLLINSAQLRSYVFIGLILGAIIYFWQFSKKSVPILIKVVGLLKMILSFIKKIILLICLMIKIPIVIIYRILKAPIVFIWKILNKIKQKIISKIPKPPEEEDNPWDEQ